jgi:hypothetical protein
MNYQSVAPFIHDGTITWTMTTNGYKFYTLNLITTLRQAKIPWKLCIICCDSESFLFFRREGIPCIPYDIENGAVQLNVAAFGTDEFAKWNRKKVELLKWFADGGAGKISNLYLDGDIFVQKDPWPVLKGLFECSGNNLFFQCDCANANYHDGCGVICSGVIAMREPRPEYSELYTFVESEWAAARKQDQVYIGNRLQSLSIPYKTLRRDLWGNGHWQMSMKWKDDPSWILLHYNYRVAGTKKTAMKKYGHWVIPY